MPGPASIVGTAVEGVNQIVGEQSYANRKERKLLKTDIKAMENRELGYSDAQRNTLIAGQNRQSAAQIADQMAQMQRAQNAAGTGRAGGYDTQRGQLLAGQQAATAQFSTGVENASSQLAQNQRANILGRLAGQTKKNTHFWAEQGRIANQGAENFSGGGMMGGIALLPINYDSLQSNGQ